MNYITLTPILGHMATFTLTMYHLTRIYILGTPTLYFINHITKIRSCK